MLILFLIILIFLAYLIYEQILLNKWISSIPLRISVTGTRGKTSVVRMIASVLRENDSKVLAKTTGSEAKFIFPDGKEISIHRSRIPSVIEQKTLLKKAATHHVDCIVAEIMSIHAENHYIESQRILRPNIVVITNVRFDHIDAMGKTKDEIAAILYLDIPKNATVFVPENEIRPIFQHLVENAKRDFISVQEKISSVLFDHDSESKQIEFSDNLDLVYAVGRHLKIDESTISKGIHKARHDIGQLKIWIYRNKASQTLNYFVNAFAANDPESTFAIILKLKEILPSVSNKLVGLLSLRSDRGDRTVQWIESLKNGATNYFNRIYVMGTHAKIVKQKVKWVHVLREKSPERITSTILNEIENQTVIFGFGNICGTGKHLVDYWNKIGEAYGV